MTRHIAFLIERPWRDAGATRSFAGRARGSAACIHGNSYRRENCADVRRVPSNFERITMATAPKKTLAKPVAPDATALLRADHKKVDELFQQYEKTRASTRKRALVAQICLELSIHAQVEEEIFYPAVQAALKDKELVPEARVEHATLKELIAQVKDKAPEGEMFDAKIKVLSEYVKHHVKEEQTEMFPRAKKTKLDMRELGARIEARKDELKASPELLDAPPVPASQALAVI